MLKITKRRLFYSKLQYFSFLGPLEIKAFKILMSEIEVILFGCIAILPRLTSLSVVIDDLKPNLKNLIRGLNLRRGLGMVGST